MSESAIPTVVIDGKHWPVPLLAPKQNSYVVPNILPLIAKMEVIARSAASGAPSLETMSMVFDEETFGKALNCLFLALQRGTPELTRAEFDDMAVPTIDLMNAIPAIAKATGLIREAAPGEAPVGEHLPGAISSPTGNA